MIRSKKMIFVPFCALCQGIRAQGLVKKYPSSVEPIINFFVENKINIIQMDCPEINYSGTNGGIVRTPCGKKVYDVPEYRNLCQTLAEKNITLIRNLISNGYEVIGITGLENSPSCSANYLFRGGRKVKGKGIFIEEIEKELKENNLSIPIIGINLYGIKKTLNDLNSIL